MAETRFVQNSITWANSAIPALLNKVFPDARSRNAQRAAFAACVFGPMCAAIRSSVTASQLASYKAKIFGMLTRAKPQVAARQTATPAASSARTGASKEPVKTTTPDVSATTSASSGVISEKYQKLVKLGLNDPDPHTFSTIEKRLKADGSPEATAALEHMRSQRNKSA